MPDEVVTPEASTEDILFAEEPISEEDKPLVLDGKEEDKEVKEEDEKDEEIKLKDEDEFKIVTPVSRKDITDKYPDLYKHFPFIETALRQHKEFTELLPTIDDAKEVMEKAGAYDNLYAEAMQGKTESILSAVKEEDAEAFNRIVDDYLPTLARVDQVAFTHVVGNFAKEIVQRMYSEAREHKNEALETTAHMFHQWFFGTTKWSDPSKLAKPTDKVDEVKQQEEKFVQERFHTVLEDLNTRVSNVLKATIDNNIDPASAMTPFVKKHAIREAMEHLETLITNDKQYRAINDRLWQNAYRSNFSQESLNKIRSNYLARAKSLLKPVLAKARSEALTGQGLKVKEDDNKDRSGRLPVGRSAGQKTTTASGKSTDSAMKPGESTYDFFMR